MIKITEGGAELIGLPTVSSRGNDRTTVYSDLLCYGARPEGGTAFAAVHYSRSNQTPRTAYFRFSTARIGHPGSMSCTRSGSILTDKPPEKSQKRRRIWSI